MPMFLRRKRASTPLDVLGPASADDAYATLPRELVRKSIPAGELIDRVRAEGVA